MKLRFAFGTEERCVRVLNQFVCLVVMIQEALMATGTAGGRSVAFCPTGWLANWLVRGELVPFYLHWLY
jgi:hypothetical protein